MLNKNSCECKKRYPHIDILRLMAIYLVMFNHTSERGYTLFFEKIESPISFLYMMFSVFCKIAVPLFFMISGALLLGREESLKQLFSKRVFRIVIVLVPISALYYYLFEKENGLAVGSFLKYIYSNSAATLLWYLYSYLALLLMLPFLRSMVKKLEQKYYIYLMIGYIVFCGVLPCIEALLWNGETTVHPSFSPVFFLTQNVFFALMGYCFEHVFDTALRNPRTYVIGGVLSAVAIVLTCLMTYWQIKTGEEGTTLETEKFFECFICIPTITVYCVTKRLSDKIKSESACKWISVLGSAVFGVYLIEKLLRLVTRPVYALVVAHVGSFVGSLMWCVATLCLGLIIVVSIKHIPGVKKIVNKFI